MWLLFCWQIETGITEHLLAPCLRSIMSDIQRDNRVVSLSSRAGIRNSLVTILDQLQRCQKSLNEFLEVNTHVWEDICFLSHGFQISPLPKCGFVSASQEKRSAFPRFYFIGDDDLLEILGQATNPSVIQSHLKKLFAGQRHVCSYILLLLMIVCIYLLSLCLLPFVIFVHIVWIITVVLDSEGSLHIYSLCRHPQCCVWWAMPAHCRHVFFGGRNCATQKYCTHLQPCGGKAMNVYKWINSIIIVGGLRRYL